DMGNYVVATTTDTDETGPKTPGRINGGFFARKPDWPGQHPSVVVAVDDIDKAIRKVRDAGGRVLGGPVEIPGVGQYVSFTDTEGNRVAMLQPIPRNWHARKWGKEQKTGGEQERADEKRRGVGRFQSSIPPGWPAPQAPTNPHPVRNQTHA